MPTITLTVPNSPTTQMTVLLDTGASTSLIKHSAFIPEKTYLDKNDFVNIRGITATPVTTLVSTNLTMCSVNGLKFNHKVYVKIGCDGILESDFFMENKVIIDYKTTSHR